VANRVIAPFRMLFGNLCGRTKNSTKSFRESNLCSDKELNRVYSIFKSTTQRIETKFLVTEI